MSGLRLIPFDQWNQNGYPTLAAFLYLRLRGPQRQVFVVGVIYGWDYSAHILGAGLEETAQP